MPVLEISKVKMDSGGKRKAEAGMNPVSDYQEETLKSSLSRIC
jgi:hypothetical protein